MSQPALDRPELREHLLERYPGVQVELCEIWDGPNGATERIYLVCSDLHSVGAMVPREVVKRLQSDPDRMQKDEFGNLWSVGLTPEGQTTICRHFMVEDAISTDQFSARSLRLVQSALKRIAKPG